MVPMETRLRLDPAKFERALRRSRKRFMVLLVVAVAAWALLSNAIYALAGWPLPRGVLLIDGVTVVAIFGWILFGGIRARLGVIFERVSFLLTEDALVRDAPPTEPVRLDWRDVVAVHEHPSRGWFLVSRTGNHLRVPAEIAPAEPFVARLAGLPSGPWTHDDLRFHLADARRVGRVFSRKLDPRRGLVLRAVAIFAAVHLLSWYALR